MREITKSLGSFGWAMSLFGLKRLAEMLAPGDGRGGPAGSEPGVGGGPEAFDRLTDAAREHLGDGGFFPEAFRSGDRIFRTLIDIMLGGGCSDCPPGWAAGDPRRRSSATRPAAGDWSPASGSPGGGSGARPAGPAGWGPMPSAAASPPPPAAGAAPAAGGWGPMPGAESSAAGSPVPGADAAGARGWGPMPPVPPPGAPTS